MDDLFSLSISIVRFREKGGVQRSNKLWHRSNLRKTTAPPPRIGLHSTYKDPCVDGLEPQKDTAVLLFETSVLVGLADGGYGQGFEAPRTQKVCNERAEALHQPAPPPPPTFLDLQPHCASLLAHPLVF